jgi:hypothetical protein
MVDGTQQAGGDGQAFAGSMVTQCSPMFTEVCACNYQFPVGNSQLLPAFTPASELLQTHSIPYSSFSQTLPAFEANRPQVSDQQPTTTIHILPPNSTTPADMTIGPDGAVAIRQGFDQLAGRPSDLYVSVAPNTPPEVVQQAIEGLVNKIDDKWTSPPNSRPDVQLDDPQHLAGATFQNEFNQAHHRTPNQPDENDRLPDNPPMPPDGGGGGGGGIRPPNPDAPPDIDRPPNEPENGPERGTLHQRLENLYNQLTREGGDANLKHFGNWFLKMLPQSVLEKLARFGPPPWTPEQQAEIENVLKEELAKPENQQALAANLDAQIAKLNQAGFTAEAGKLTELKNSISTALSDPEKRGQFVHSLVSFMSNSNATTGAANLENLHGLTGNNLTESLARERAIRFLLLIQQAEANGTNLSQLSPEQMRRIIQQLQMGPTSQPAP